MEKTVTDGGSVFKARASLFQRRANTQSKLQISLQLGLLKSLDHSLPENRLFKTLGRKKVLRTNTAQLSKAQETYLKVLKTQEQAQRDKIIKKEQNLARGKISQIDFTKVKIESLSESQLRQVVEEQVAQLSILKKQEVATFKKIEAYENVKQLNSVDDIPTLKKSVDQLKESYMTVIRQYNRQRSKIENQKKTLLRRNEDPEFHPRY